MQKNIIKSSLFASLILLLNGNLASASNLDWESSTMMVEFTKEHAQTPPFSCFTFTQNRDNGPCSAYNGSHDFCVWENLEILGFSDEEPNPEIDNCFKQAGDYQVTTEIKDYAQNSADLDIITFAIEAGNPSLDNSELTHAANCNPSNINDRLVANGQETCALTLNIKDAFNNPVTQLKNQTVKVLSTSTFPEDANSGERTMTQNGFQINGSPLPTRFNDGDTVTPHNLTINNSNTVTGNINLSSYVPTMSLVGSFLGKTEAKNLNLEIQVPSILSDGNLDASNPVIFEYNSFSPEIVFHSWGTASLEFAHPKLLLDVVTPLSVVRNIYSGLTSGGPNSLVKLLLIPHRLPAGLEIQDLTLAPDENNVVNQNTIYSPILKTLLGDINVSGDIAFTSKVSYNIDGKSVSYPSGAAGKIGNFVAGDADGYTGTPLEVGIVGASVEGNLLNTKNETILQDEHSLRLGGIALKDVREAVFANAYRISRGVLERKAGDPGVGTSMSFDKNWFSSTNQVAVFDGVDIFMGTTDMPTGKNTLVIKNANLIIEGDMTYSSLEDSFGVILINDSVQEAPSTANILIRPDVQHMVGTYFSEGGIMSVNNTALKPTINDVINGHVSLGKQLVFEGTVLAHNTFGGSFTKVGSNTYKTPWKTVSLSEISQAVMYDLHNVRRYYPQYDDPANPLTQTNIGDCYEENGSCITNSGAFVIKVDKKATQLAPPGFENVTFFNQKTN